MLKNYDDKYRVIEDEFEDHSIVNTLTCAIVAQHIPFAGTALNLKFQLDNDMIKEDEIATYST